MVKLRTPRESEISRGVLVFLQINDAKAESIVVLLRNIRFVKMMRCIRMMISIRIMRCIRMMICITKGECYEKNMGDIREKIFAFHPNWYEYGIVTYYNMGEQLCKKCS